MSFDWGHYLGLAEDLLLLAESSDKAEACHRSACSRAYYAAFKKSAEHLAQWGVAIPSDGTGHRLVQEQMDRHSRTVSLRLAQLRRSRNDADYADPVVIWARQARKSCMDAGEVLRLLAGQP